jgi:hypothetical protein
MELNQDEHYKVYSLQYYTPPWYIRLLLLFKTPYSHIDYEGQRGCVYKMIGHTIYVYFTFSYTTPEQEEERQQGYEPPKQYPWEN